MSNKQKIVRGSRTLLLFALSLLWKEEWIVDRIRYLECRGMIERFLKKENVKKNSNRILRFRSIEKVCREGCTGMEDESEQERQKAKNKV